MQDNTDCRKLHWDWAGDWDPCLSIPFYIGLFRECRRSPTHCGKDSRLWRKDMLCMRVGSKIIGGSYWVTMMVVHPPKEEDKSTPIGIVIVKLSRRWYIRQVFSLKNGILVTHHCIEGDFQSDWHNGHLTWFLSKPLLSPAPRVMIMGT